MFITSRCNNNIHNVPYKWIFEGSNDLIKWDLLHHKERGNELIGVCLEGHWESVKNKEYKYFKFTQIGENRYLNDFEKYIFSIGMVELFGILIPDSLVCSIISCFQKSSYINTFIIIFITQIYKWFYFIYISFLE